MEIDLNTLIGWIASFLSLYFAYISRKYYKRSKMLIFYSDLKLAIEYISEIQSTFNKLSSIEVNTHKRGKNDIKESIEKIEDNIQKIRKALNAEMEKWFNKEINKDISSQFSLIRFINDIKLSYCLTDEMREMFVSSERKLSDIRIRFKEEAEKICDKINQF